MTSIMRTQEAAKVRLALIFPSALPRKGYRLSLRNNVNCEPWQLRNLSRLPRVGVQTRDTIKKGRDARPHCGSLRPVLQRQLMQIYVLYARRPRWLCPLLCAYSRHSKAHRCKNSSALAPSGIRIPFRIIIRCSSRTGIGLKTPRYLLGIREAFLYTCVKRTYILKWEL